LPADWLTDPSVCWYEWQGLVSGILAVAAAAASIWFLNRQISQTSDLHRGELGRRHNAIRSVLPIALASVSDFCTAIVDQIATAIEDRQNDFDAAFDAAASGRHNQKSFDPVAIPVEVISTMQQFVESLTREADVKHMAELLSSLQILQARFNDFDLEQAAVVSGLYNLLLDAAKVKLLNDSIYNYGRFVDDSSFSVLDQPSNDKAWNSILGKAHSLVFTRRIPDLFFPELNRLVTRCKENNVSPWNERFD
jgi:hypothetical protein